MDENFIDLYLAYASDNEVPTFFHRWAALAGVGAYLGRDFYFKLGAFDINPNMYCMLIGSPGTRKSTAIKLFKNILTKTGYSTIAAEKTSKEKFLMDLSGQEFPEWSANGIQSPAAKTPDMETLLDMKAWGEQDDSKANAEMFIAADEFNNFIGNGNLEFISLLGELWDYNGAYKVRVKNSKSFDIQNPTVSILGGNTPTGFNAAFPPEALGQGFFSRLILIYGEPSGKKIPFPTVPPENATQFLVSKLKEIKSKVSGEATLTPGAKSLLEKIYNSYRGIDDVRFESYTNRRFTHLLKLCLVGAAVRYSNEISEDDVSFANTVLTYTEHLMPLALGEFGRSRHSEVAHKVMQFLDGFYGEPKTIQDIFAQVHNDVENMRTMIDIMNGLLAAKKVINHIGKGPNDPGGFLIIRKTLVSESETSHETYTDYERWMTPEELGRLGED